jgi:hypothetical protein
MFKSVILATAIATSAAAPAHAGWEQAIIGLGAFSQGVQNGQAQRYNMEHGYPAYVAPPYGNQPQPSYFVIDGRIITCVTASNGYRHCQ